MAVTNRTTSYIARRGRNLPVATGTLCDRNNPYHMGVCEDGTITGLEEDEDTTGNPRALIPYSTQPDPIVSQQAIVSYAGRKIVPRTTKDSANRPQGSTSGTIVRARNTVQVSLREDGTLCGLNSDEEIDNESKQDNTTQPRGTQGSEQQDGGDVQNEPQIADSERGAIVV